MASMQSGEITMNTEKYAYVTLLLNDSYLPGVLTLVQSIHETGSEIPIVLLISKKNLSFKTYDLLFKFNKFSRVINIDNDLIKTKQNNEFQLNSLLNRSDLLFTLTKLNIWKLTDYDRLVYLDSDMLVLKNIDNLFNLYPELSINQIIASSDSGWPDIFNSGLFIIKPDLETFNKLIDFYNNYSSFDGADQGLLNEYFNLKSLENNSKWYRLDFVYNCTINSNYEYLPALLRFKNDLKILHFIGFENKPWKNYNLCFNPTFPKIFNSDDDNLLNLFELWWKCFERIKSVDDFNVSNLEILEISGNLQPRISFNSTNANNEEVYEKHEELSNIENSDNCKNIGDTANNTLNENDLSKDSNIIPSEIKNDSSLHFPTFYYKKPNSNSNQINDESINGEAWKLKETKIEWPQKNDEFNSDLTIDEILNNGGNENKNEALNNVKYDIENNPVDQYIYNNPIFPWEFQNKKSSNKVSRTFNNLKKFKPQIYKISLMNDTNSDNKDEDLDDEILGFEDGEKFDTYLRKVEELNKLKLEDIDQDDRDDFENEETQQCDQTNSKDYDVDDEDFENIEKEIEIDDELENLENGFEVDRTEE